MAIYRTTNKLTETDAAYIAGLIDGEGTIGLTRKHAGENRQLVVLISSTEQCLMDYALETIGAGKVTRKRVSRSHHRPGLTYCVTNRQALSLLTQVQPFLRSYKKDRCRLIVDHYLALTPRNGKYTEAMRTARTVLEEKFLSLTTRIRPAPRDQTSR